MLALIGFVAVGYIVYAIYLSLSNTEVIKSQAEIIKEKHEFLSHVLSKKYPTHINDIKITDIKRFEHLFDDTFFGKNFIHDYRFYDTFIDNIEYFYSSISNFFHYNDFKFFLTGVNHLYLMYPVNFFLIFIFFSVSIFLLSYYILNKYILRKLIYNNFIFINNLLSKLIYYIFLMIFIFFVLSISFNFILFVFLLIITFNYLFVTIFINLFVFVNIYIFYFGCILKFTIIFIVYIFNYFL